MEYHGSRVSIVTIFFFTYVSKSLDNTCVQSVALAILKTTVVSHSNKEGAKKPHDRYTGEPICSRITWLHKGRN